MSRQQDHLIVVRAVGYEELAEDNQGTADDLPDDVASDLERIEAELPASENRQEVFRPEDVAIAGTVPSWTETVCS